MKIDYTKLTFTELIDKIEVNRFFDLPRMVREAFRRLTPQAPKYKVYTALLTQTGTDAPVATVLENTLGGTVVWSYVDIGTFSGITTGKFLNNKTYLYINSASETGNMLDGLAGVSQISEDEINVITITSGADVSNNILNQASIEIRVYN